MQTEQPRQELSPTVAGDPVIDLTRLLAGPYATMTLAELGADVIKIEKPNAGDDTRAREPPLVNGDSAYSMPSTGASAASL